MSSNGFPSLTPRQEQIVVLIAEDLTAKEIGERLGISPRTVDFHRVLIKKAVGSNRHCRDCPLRDQDRTHRPLAITACSAFEHSLRQVFVPP